MEPLVAKSPEKPARADVRASSGSSDSHRGNGATHDADVATFAREVARDSGPSRDSALSRAVQQIEKQFGKGAVMKMDGEKPAFIDGIATGSLSLDIALGGA